MNKSKARKIKREFPANRALSLAQIMRGGNVTLKKPVSLQLNRNPEAAGLAMKTLAEQRGFFVMPADNRFSPLCIALGSPEVESQLRQAWEQSGRPQELPI